jgi:hypothetical protein
VRWTAAAESTLREIDGRVRKELKATSFGIMLTGKTSATAAAALAARNWPVVGP